MKFRTDIQLDCGECTISTLVPFDCKSPKTYETAISHPLYKDGCYIVVEEYIGEESAQTGHNKWVKLCETNTLPNTLEDVGGGIIGEFCKTLGATSVYERQNP